MFTITRKTNNKNGVISWSKEQVHYIINSYLNEKITVKELSEKFKVRPEAIRRLLRKNNISLLGQKRGYPRNEFYFSNIDNFEKAYWLGVLYADGCVHEKSYNVSLGMSDLDHIEKFKKAIGAINHKISILEPKENRKITKNFYNLSIRDKQIHQDLIKYGCIPRKSLLLKSFPKIEENLIPHFIRGFFDGDGGICFTQDKKRLVITFTGTKEFLTNIKEYFNIINSLQKNVKAKDTYCLRTSNKNKVKEIFSILYKDSNENIRLNRKYNLYYNFYNGA